MIQLNPQEIFPITRELDNPFDTATYFVQAKVYLLKDRSLIKTVNLTDFGNQTFWGSWQVPADTSGMGTHIYIVTSVYTDAGYTQLSPTYATTNEKYLIQDRVTRSLLGGGGGYGGFAKIDYDKFYTEIEKNLEKLINKVVEEKVSGVHKAIKGIKIPKIPQFPEIPQPTQVDYGRLENTIAGHHAILKETLKNDLADHVSGFLGGHAEKMGGLMNELTGHAERVSEMTQNSTKHFSDLANFKTYLSNLGKVMQESTDSIREDVKGHITKETATQTKTLKDHVAKHHAFTNKNIENR